MNIFPVFQKSSFIKTREQYHLIVQLIGKIRETLVKPIAKNDNLWLSVVDKGFCMPAIESLNELEVGCNIETMKVEVANSKDYKAIDLNGKSVGDISKELNKILNDFGVNAEIDFSAVIRSKSPPSRGGAWEREILNLTNIDSKDFLIQLYNYHRLLKEFHSRIREGVKTQVCLWPHHFDNGFRWFSGRKINEQDEQMGIGVSNGDDSYSLPYIYMTFWPELRRTNKLEIIDGAILHDSGWTGMVLPYEPVSEMKTIDGQKKLIEDFFNITFESVKREFSKR
jgi:hypothetical protein